MATWCRYRELELSLRTPFREPSLPVPVEKGRNCVYLCIDVCFKVDLLSFWDCNVGIGFYGVVVGGVGVRSCSPFFLCFQC